MPPDLERVLAAPLAIRDRRLAEKKRASTDRKQKLDARLRLMSVGVLPKLELEPDARLAVVDDAPAVRERVEEREPPPRSASASGIVVSPLGEAAAAIADLRPHVRVGDGHRRGGCASPGAASRT